MTARILPLPLRNTGGRPTPASIQTAAQDPDVQDILADHIERRELHDTIRAQRVIIWGLITAVVGLAVLA